MNFQSLVYLSAAERLQVNAVLALESINVLEEVIALSEACCDLYDYNFNGEVAEA
jgi:hypothetical protein